MHLIKYSVVLMLLAIVSIGSEQSSADAAAASLKSQAVTLATNGNAQLPILIEEDASPRVQAAAASLADMLKRITGGTFEVSTSQGKGIHLRVVSEVKQLGLTFDPELQIPDREAFAIFSADGSVHLNAATDLAAEHAVWEMLHHLGYRHYFPGQTWEIIPHAPDLSINIKLIRRPSYYYRNMFYGYGSFMRQGGTEPFMEWAVHNHVSAPPARASVALQTAHSYAGIASAFEDVWKEHPEYLAMVNGKRPRNKNSQKFCTSNPGLRALLSQNAADVIAKNPDRQSLSRDPSDLDNWCECPECAKLGGPTNQAVMIANEAAQAIEEKVGPRVIGMYAYNQHSPPPTIKVHPNVVVSVATSFIRGGYSLDELLSGWSAQGATLGIREYYSVYTWDRDLPGKARAANSEYITSTLPRFHNLGVRYMTAEMSENWGPHGLNYYIASRLMWDINQAQHVPDIVDDFLTRSFGPAKSPMTDFYDLINKSKRLILSEDLIARMYSQLDRARKSAANDPAVLARIHHLILYTRYVELYLAYTRQDDDQDRQKAFEQLARHTWRIGTTRMVDTVAIWRDLPRRDKKVTYPEGAGYRVKDDENPWKNTDPFTDQEIDTFITQGLANNQKLEVEAIDYSDELVPAKRLQLEHTSFKSFMKDKDYRTRATSIADGHRGRRTYYLWIDKPGEIELGVTGGLIAKYRDRGNVTLSLFSKENPSLEAEDEDDSTVPNGEKNIVKLRTQYAGLHELIISDGSDRTRIDWPEDLMLTSMGPAVAGRWYLYFYVPKGTKKVAGFANHSSGSLLGADGSVLFNFNEFKTPGYFTVDVPPGQDGKLWKFHHVLGVRNLLNVPPYFATSADKLLLPVEVVESDMPQSR